MKPPIAVIVDGDQLPPDGLPPLLAKLGRKWHVNERICVRNWRSSKDLEAWRDFAEEHGFRLIQRDPVAVGKNASDIELAVIAMDLLHDGYMAFCLVSGDTDFKPLVSRLRRSDATVEWIRPDEIAVARSGRGSRTRGGRSGRGRGAKASPAASKSGPAAAAKEASPTPTKAPAKKGRRRGKGSRSKGSGGKSTPSPPAAAAKRPQPPRRNDGPPPLTDDQKGFAKPVRRAIQELIEAGRHEKGWVSVHQVGSMLGREGVKREDFNIPKRRPVHTVLEQLGLRVEQIETGSWRVTLE